MMVPNSKAPILIDLSQPLNENTPVYRGDLAFRRAWHSTLERDGFNVSRLETGAHAGAHVDSPLHFLAGGADVSSMPLASFYGNAVAIDAPKNPGGEVGLEDVAGVEIRAGDIVLFRTGWEDRAGTESYFGAAWPGYTVELVEFLIARGVKAIGGDSPSADSPAAIEAGSPAHHLLGRAGLPIFECLINLNQVAGRRFIFCGFPLKIQGSEASPVRAVAIVY